jgi:hypothetical protein
MAMTDPMTGGFFAIDRNNTWLHVYPDVPSMLAVNRVGAGDAADFFDTRGRRYDPVFADTGQLEALKETADPPNTPIVAMRLKSVLNFLVNALPQRLHDAPNPPGTVAEGLAVIPRLDGLTLPECHLALTTVFGDGTRRGAIHIADDGSFWHNFWCHSL